MMEKINIAYCYKSGMGIEIARIGTWLSVLTKTCDVTLYSFHHYIYDPAVMKVRPLTEMNHADVVLGDADEGIAFYSHSRPNGPLRAHVLEEEARQRGYHMITEEAADGTNVYQTSLNQVDEAGLKMAGEGKFLKMGKPHGRFILNIFGGACLSKGIREGNAAKIVARGIAEAFPEIEFIIPCLPHQKNILLEEVVTKVKNLALCNFGYDDEEFTLLVSGSPRIITVEGGMLHLGTAYRKPVFCLIEKKWMMSVVNKLPLDHGVHYELLEFSSPHMGILIESIKEWMHGR